MVHWLSLPLIWVVVLAFQVVTPAWSVSAGHRSALMALVSMVWASRVAAVGSFNTAPNTHVATKAATVNRAMRSPHCWKEPTPTLISRVNHQEVGLGVGGPPARRQ